jgi:glycerol kinase
VDYSIASTTGLMNLQKTKLIKKHLGIAGITEQHLSQLLHQLPISKINQTRLPLESQYANCAEVMQH